MKLKIYIALILPIILCFCTDSINESNYRTFELSDTLTIKYHQILYNEQEDISIKFESLVGDSRCPIDAICVWEGDAEVKFSLKKNDTLFDFSLHTSKNYFNTDTLIIGYRIELIDVYPYPQSNVNYNLEEYSTKVIISKPKD
ncbi:MAG: hypothetical protein H6613_10415 [Ignavibacteriales bacterium]|nr:hypothetical protein [Ignavibacteriota bacterium]MCB9248913.1 hypothetical protein [Ignavibacteriales bacterium]